MLEEGLAALAMAGASALVGAAATDGWRGVKTGFARLLGRGDERRTAATDQELEKVRAELLVHRSEHVRVALLSAWSSRLAELLTERPHEVDHLIALIARAGGEPRLVQQAKVYDHGRQAIQGQGVQVNQFGPRLEG